MTPENDITRKLIAHSEGDAAAAEDLLPLVYERLRRLAADHMRRERPDHTLEATALVHEAYLRLVDQDDVQWRGRTHFFAIAAQMMPRVLIDHARRKTAAKRRHDLRRVSLDGIVSPRDDRRRDVDIVALGEALDELRALGERQACVVELRFFGGLSVKEIASELGVSEKTVKRDWRFARAWLQKALKDVT